LGVEVAIVIGGGNIFRGASAAKAGIDRVQGDYMGMLATVINGMAVQASLEKQGLYTRMMTAIKVEAVCEPFHSKKSDASLRKRSGLLFLVQEQETPILQRILLPH
jgi:uridylate kinase